MRIFFSPSWKTTFHSAFHICRPQPPRGRLVGKPIRFPYIVHGSSDMARSVIISQRFLLSRSMEHNLLPRDVEWSGALNLSREWTFDFISPLRCFLVCRNWNCKKKNFIVLFCKLKVLGKVWVLLIVFTDKRFQQVKGKIKLKLLQIQCNFYKLRRQTQPSSP